jgi:hypothetical protein
MGADSFPTSWDEYFNGIKPRLNKRSAGFQKIFDFLAGLNNPVIVETGTYREENNYEGDGCSTLLFDSFVDYHGGVVLSVDIDPEACELAKENTLFTEVIESDSVEFLGTLEGKIDLLYLDSYNIARLEQRLGTRCSSPERVVCCKKLHQGRDHDCGRRQPQNYPMANVLAKDASSMN